MKTRKHRIHIKRKAVVMIAVAIIVALIILIVGLVTGRNKTVSITGSTLTYYIDDELKYGGQYITLNAKVIKIDDYENCISLDSGLKIDVTDIFSIEII